MDTSSSLAIFPYPLAFITYLMKFYMHENAATIWSLSFALAVGSIVVPASFVLLTVLHLLFPFAALAYCLAGVVLAINGMYRLRRI